MIVSSPPRPADRILLVRLGSLGDVVRTLPAVSSLRAGLPGCHLAWLVEPACAGAVGGQPWIDEVLTFPRGQLVRRLRGGQLVGAARRFGSFLERLRGERFDWVLDFHGLARSACLSLLSGAPRRLGYAAPAARELSWLASTERVALPRARISRFVRNQALVRRLGVTQQPAARPFRIDAEARRRMSEALGSGPAIAVLHAGSSASSAAKRYPPERLGQVARRLGELEGLRCLASFGPAPSDRAAAEALVAASQGAARLAPATDCVQDLAALLEASRLCIAADTGPLQLAALVGAPVVQLLGPTDPVENAPWPRTPQVSLAHASRRADAVPVARVVEAARGLLARSASGAVAA